MRIDHGSRFLRSLRVCAACIAFPWVSHAQVISGQPSSVFAAVGQTTTLSVTAVGSGLSYQWRKQGVPIAGATTSSLTLTNVRLEDSGSYDVVVAAGAVTYASNSCRVDVRPSVVPTKVLPRIGFAPLVEGATLNYIPGMAAAGDGIIIWGDFYSIDHVVCPGLVRIAADGSLDPSFSPDETFAYISGVVPLPNGRFLAYGGNDASTAPDVTSPILLNADGSRDASLVPAPSLTQALVVPLPDGSIVTATALAGSYVFKVKKDGSADTAFNSGTFGGRINSMVGQPDGKILVGGSFSSVKGVVCPQLVRLNADGTLDPTFSIANGFSNLVATATRVRNIALQSDGKILVAGEFAGASNTTRPYMLRLNPNGTVDGSFNANLSASVSILALGSDGRTLVKLSSDLYSGVLVRLNSDGTLDSGFNSGGQSLGALSVDNAVLTSSGAIFTLTNGTLQRLTANGMVDPTFAHTYRYPAFVKTIVPAAENKWLIGGNFYHVGGQPRHGIARLNADGTVDPTFDPGSGINGTDATNAIQTIIPQADGKIVAAGNFASFNGAPRGAIVRLGSDGSVDLTFGIKFTNDLAGTLPLIVEQQGNGGFVVAAGSYIGFYDANGSFTGYSNNAINRTMYAATWQPDGKLLIATDPVPGMSNLMRLNLDGSIDSSFQVPNGVLGAGDYAAGTKSLVLQPDGKLLAAFNGIPIRMIRFLATGAVDQTFSTGQGFNRPIHCFTLEGNGRILVAGDFTSYSGTACNGIVRLNADGSLDPSFGAPTLNIGQFVASSLAYTADGGILAAGNPHQISSNVGPGLVKLETPTAQLSNCSVRTFAGTDENTLIVGCGISGVESKHVLFRAIGPSLRLLGVDDVLLDPQLRIFNDAGAEVNFNDDWGGAMAAATAFQRLGAFAIPADSKDSALFTNLAVPATYTAHVTSSSGTGIALLEAYDNDGSAAAHFSNLSARAHVATGSGILVMGFVVTGETAKTLLIRGIGPGLVPLGVAASDVLADPQLTLFNRNSNPINANNDWGGSSALAATFKQCGAFDLPTGSQDAALLVTLPPGVYTVQLSGVNDSTGVGLVELYEVP